MDKRLKNGIAAVALASWAAGCATGPDFRPPAAPENESWGEATNGAAQQFDAKLDASAEW